MRKTRLRAAAQAHADAWGHFVGVYGLQGHGVVLVADPGGLNGVELGRADTVSAAIQHYGREAQIGGADYQTDTQALGLRVGIYDDAQGPRVRLKGRDPFSTDHPPCVACGRLHEIWTFSGLLRGTRPGTICGPCSSRARRLGLLEAFPHLAQRSGPLPEIRKGPLARCIPKEA